MRYIYILKEICIDVVGKIRNWFRREPSMESLKEELYSPESMAIFVQTLEQEADFRMILGSIIERMSEVSGIDLELNIVPRA